MYNKYLATLFGYAGFYMLKIAWNPLRNVRNVRSQRATDHWTLQRVIKYVHFISKNKGHTSKSSVTTVKPPILQCPIVR